MEWSQATSRMGFWPDATSPRSGSRTAQRGRRLVVTGRAASGRLLVAVLYPVSGDPGIFNLGTARWRAR
jgi:hypothetical protein